MYLCTLYYIIYVHLYFFALVSRQSATLSSATQHAMPPELGRNWGTECLNTRFSLPTLLCAGTSWFNLITIYVNYDYVVIEYRKWSVSLDLIAVTISKIWNIIIKFKIKSSYKFRYSKRNASNNLAERRNGVT